MNWILWAAFAAALAATLAATLNIRKKSAELDAFARRALRTATGLAFAALVALLVLFLTADVRTEYVFLYTHANTPLRFRVAGIWAGREGSLALWALYAVGIAAYASRKAMDRGTVLGLSALGAAFLGAAAQGGMFDATSQFLLQQKPLGNGLNPTLQSDFFLIHPPLMFLAYALTNVPAAAALSSVVSGRQFWSHVARDLARFNWLIYTVAMGLGGIWAYYTLGFGGYWAWDPVEVANLLPWLALTLYLHVQLHHSKHGSFAKIGPFFALLPLLLTLFSTISTRSGLWISVHAFTDPTQTFNPDAVGRFQDILTVEPTLAFYVGFTMGLFFGFLAAWSLQLTKATSTRRWTAALLATFAAWSLASPSTAYGALAQAGWFVARGNTATGMLLLVLAAVLLAGWPLFVQTSDQKTGINVRGLNYAAVLILGLSLLVLWLWHMVAANGWSTSFYEQRIPFVAAPAVGALTVFMALPLGKNRALLAAGFGLLAGAAWAAVARDPGMLLLGSSVVFFGFALDRVRRAAGGNWSSNVLAVGALLNVVFWINAPSTLFGWLSVGWPVQLLVLPALLGLHRALQHMNGRADGQGTTRLMVGALGGFYVAPLLAIASHFLPQHRASWRPRKMGQVGLFVVHLAVAVALVGYSTSTYFGDEQEVNLMLGGASDDVAFDAVQEDSAAGLVSQYQVVLDVGGPVAGTLAWEPLSNSYYPSPGTLRFWHGDVFVAVDAVCFDDCDSRIDRIMAYEQTFQAPADREPHSMTAQVHTLPGLGLVWASLALFGYGMFLLMRHATPLQERLTSSA